MNNLVEINSNNCEAIIDLKYATKNNVCQKILYQKPLCLLHPEAFEKLQIAIKYAKDLGYKIKIFDGYRPLEVQKFMFDFFQNNIKYQSFFSNPQTGSIPHCRGVAIDLTLCDFNGKEIDMGSEFDELSDLAHHNSKKISQIQNLNRNILLGIMTYAGFDFYKNEWWHYQLFNARAFEIADVRI